jgi:hypothetical protein
MPAYVVKFKKGYFRQSFPGSEQSFAKTKSMATKFFNNSPDDVKKEFRNCTEPFTIEHAYNDESVEQ